ncbi:MAG: 1-acyl-sn-glycerol-3-phosphate acyltransferase [Rhodospirillaceae bacterium]|nr:1-acyl-sn-glycerol-3-phosphate acyltransferase [Rhodospirillaceae bacterium]
MLTAAETAPLALPAAASAGRPPAVAASPGRGERLRSRLFNAVFLGFTFLFVLSAYPLLLLPSRRPLARAIQRWARGVLWLMRRIAGIRVAIAGRENLPKTGPYILASKHQSEADGIILLAHLDDVAFVAMKEVGRYPLVGPLLRKLDMVLVDTDGGLRERATLAAGGRRAAAAGRPILIYPEGTLMKVGERGRYRPGVYHLAAEIGVPVVPVATDIGRCWDRRQKTKRPGTGTVAFLPPMQAGADKRAFMAALEEAIELESQRLAARTP